MDTSSPFNPNSPQTLAISNLFVLSLVISAIIFVLVTGLVVYIALRYRRRGAEGEPRQVAGNNKLEVAWTLAPAVVIVTVFGLSIPTMRAADPPQNREPDIIVIGHQWWWEIRYPQSGIVTANELHIPAGRPLVVRLESADVIHSFWVPQLGPMRDLIPGKTNTITIQSDTPGTFGGACTEYCGLHHAWMRIHVTAHPQAEFDAWQQQQGRQVAAPAAAVAEGARVFAERTCVNCHVIGNTGIPVGPDLTHLASRETLAAGVLENTPENLYEWIKNPQQYKPGSYMPDLQLPEDELRALVAYLETLR